MRVGLTGGIGSGKSTVAKMFTDLGVPVYDSDKQAKALMRNDSELKSALVSLFGEMAYTDGNLNRTFIAAKVFNDKKMLERVNKIVHPAVRKHFSDWEEKQDFRYVIQETALIFENKMEAQYDKIILITAPLESRIERVVLRDDVARSAVMARMENQLPDDEKIPRADFTIENTDLSLTQKKVAEIHLKLLNNT